MKNLRPLVVTLLSLFLSSAMITNTGSAQTTGRFNIAISPSSFLKDGDTVILKVHGLKINDTLIAHQQTIFFQGSVSEPADAFIKTGGKQYYFPIVNDNIRITIENADSVSVTYETSKVNDNVASYYRMTDAYIRDFHALDRCCINKPANECQMILDFKLDSLAVAFLIKLLDEYKGKQILKVFH